MREKMEHKIERKMDRVRHHALRHAAHEHIRHEHHHGPGAFVGAWIGGTIAAGVIAVLLGWAVMLLWNWLMPPLFGFHAIGYWQGVGLILLGHLIFGVTARPWYSRRSRHFHYYGAGAGPGPSSSADAGDAPESRGEEHCRTRWRAGWGRWRWYDRYWKEEGQAAFEKYVEKHEGKGKA